MDLVLSEPKIFFNIASLFLNLVVLVFSIKRFYQTHFFQNKQSNYFCLLILSILIAATMEIVRTLSYHYPYASDSTYFFPRFIQSINFITSTFMLLCCTLYLNSLIEKPTKFSKVVFIVNFTIFTLYCIICLLNIKLGWIVSYDPAVRKYDLVRGPLYGPVGYLVPIYMITIEVLIFIYNINLYTKQIKWTILVSILASSVFMIIQPMVSNYVSIVPFGATISLYIWFIAIENDDYKKLQKVIGKLSLAQQEALQANNAKNAFLTNMSHEIRTPLNVIMGLDEMILSTRNKEEIRNYAQDIYDSGKNLLSIINNILDYSKLESDKLEIIKAEYHLWDALEIIKTEFMSSAQNKGLDFSLDIDESLPDNLCGDIYHISQVLRNIISNSIKYTSNGYVKITVRGEREDTTLHLVFEVQDSGNGIRDEDLLQLFHGFQHLETTKRTYIQGIGLGLAISHKLISLLKGRLSFKTKKGMGTSFTISIDQEIIADGSISERKEHAVNQAEKISEHQTAPECNVLIVDDNSMNLVVASGLLKKTEAKIHTCESGRTCLELMKRKKYDIIFMDHFMPEMDGVETFKKSRKMTDNLNLSTPVVILTANYSPELYDYYSGEGFADYIYKPIDRDKLYEVFFRIIPKSLIVRS